MKKNKNEKYNFHFPKEILQSDPKGVKRFKYKLKPYKGYYFTIADGYLGRNDEKTKYKIEGKTEKRYYNNREYEMAYSRSSAAYIAFPVKKTDPTYYYYRGSLYISQEPMTSYVPQYISSRQNWINLSYAFNYPLESTNKK